MRKPPAAGDIASYYGKLTGFADFCRRKLLLTTGKTPVFQIFTVEIAAHYGKKADFPDFCRRKAPLTTVRTPVSRISAVEKLRSYYGQDPGFPDFCRRSGSCSLVSRRTGTRPAIPDRLRRWTDRFPAGMIFLRAGQQAAGPGLNRKIHVWRPAGCPGRV